MKSFKVQALLILLNQVGKFPVGPRLFFQQMILVPLQWLDHGQVTRVRTGKVKKPFTEICGER